MQRSGNLGALLRNMGWMLGGRGVAAAASLAYLAILTRTLGPSDFGQFALIIGTAQAVVGFVSFQTWQIIVRYGMAHLKSNAAGPLARLLKLCLLLDAVGALAGAALAAVLIAVLAPRFGWDANFRQLSFGFAIVALLAVRSTPAGILRLYDRFGLAASAESMLTIARLIGAVIVLFANPGVTTFVIVWAASEMIAAVYFWWAALRAARELDWSAGKFAPRLALAENTGLGAFAAVTNAAHTFTLAGKNLPILVTGIYAAAAAAGAFRLAAQLGTALAKVSQIVVRAIFPEMMRSRTFAEDAHELRALVRGSLALSLVAGAVMFVLLLLIGKPVLVLIAGPEFEGAYPLVLLIGAAAIVDFAGVSFEPGLYSADRARMAFGIRLVITILHVAALFAVAPLYGVIGVAAVTLGASLLSFVLLGIAMTQALAQESGVNDEKLG